MSVKVEERITLEGIKDKTIIDFFGKYCGPCKMFAETLEQFAERNTDIGVYKVDVERAPQLAQSFGIRALPTVIFLRAGEIVNSFAGIRDLNTLQEEADAAFGDEG